MSEFQLAKSQRVLIPVDVAGAENVWGVVAGYHAKLGREPLYDVQWQSAYTVDEHFNFTTAHATIAESKLILAQPPKMIAKTEADDLAEKAYRKGADELRDELEQERVHRAAARKRKKPAKSKSKSKRWGR